MERSRSRTFPRAILFFTVFLDFAGFGMILPLLPFYADRYGADPLQIGLLFAAYSLAQAVFAPVLGRLSDRLGRRPVLIASIAVNALSLVAFAFAQTFTQLLVTRIVSGLAAANFSIAQAYVADVTPPERRASGLGMIGAALGLGFVLGPAMAGLLSFAGQAAIPLGAAALAAVNVVLVIARLPESLDADAKRKSEGRPLFPLAALRHTGGSLTSLLLLFFVITFAFASMEATLALFVEARYGFGVRATSWLLVAIGCVLAATQGGLVGRAVRRYGEAVTVEIGLATMTIGLAGMAFAPSVPTFVTASLVLAFGAGLNNPALLGLVSQLSQAEDQGAVLGLSRSMGSLARTAGPLWGGYAFRSLGVEIPFGVAAAIMAASCVVAWPLLQRAAAARPSETASTVLAPKPVDAGS